MRDAVIQTLMGAISSVAFAVFFNVRGKKLILFFFTGALDWAVYLVCEHFGCNPFLSMFFATMTAALSSEIFARIIRTPVLTLLVPTLVPLIPGGALYRTMDGLVQGDKARFLEFGKSAITSAAAICLGIICITAITHMVFAIIEHFTKRQHHRP